MNIGVVIPAHPARIANGMLDRALHSVHAQTLPAAEIHIAIDRGGEGGRATRTRGVRSCTAEWTALLDSDDEMHARHLEKLIKHATRTGADYVYPWYTVVGGRDPRPLAFGVPFDPRAPQHHPSSVLVRTELAQHVMSALPPKHTQRPPLWSDDYAFLIGCLRTGARIVHLPERTWYWHHHGENSSSVPGRGDA